MARNRNNEDDSYLHVSSRQNLEEEARIAKELGKDVADSFFKSMKSVQDRLSENLKRETSNLQNLAAQAAEYRNAPSASIRDTAYKNILSQTGKGEKFDVNWNSIISRSAKEFAGILADGLSIYVTKPVTSAISDMSSAYETNFTNIAGRMGTDRKETYNIMKSAVKELNDSAYKSAINANKELIPFLNAAANKGWKGSEAVSVALTNAVDSKIMPWLDTSSDAWTNIQFNVSEGLQQTLKSQQLLLQESRSGNRLLQSGVINQLTSDIAPILSNIDYNTMDQEKLPEQLSNLMQSYVDKGYDTAQAYQKAKDALNMYRNPTDYIQSDKANEVLQARAVLYGGDIKDIEDVNNYFSSMAADMPNMLAAATYGKTTGVNTYNGGTRSEDYLQNAKASSSFINGTYTDLSGASSSIYQQAANNAKEKVTATTAWDNKIQNTITDWSYWMNKWAHGPEMLSSIATHVKNIALMFAGKAIGDFAINKFGGSGGQTFTEAVKQMFNVGGSKSAGKVAAETIAKGVVENGGTAGLSSGASLGTTLSSIGGGSSLAGAAAVAAPLVAGAAIGGYGIKQGINDVKEGDNKARGAASIAGGAAAAAGGIGVAGGMLAAGAANAWNPVGWGLLIGGAVTVAATGISRWADNLNQADEQMKAKYDSLASTMDKESKSREDTVKSAYLTLSDTRSTEEDINAARKSLVEQGIMSENDARNSSVEALKSLTDAYIRSTKDFDKNRDDFNKDVNKELQKAGEKNFSDPSVLFKDGLDKTVNGIVAGMTDKEKAEITDQYGQIDKSKIDITNTDFGRSIQTYMESMVSQLEAVDEEEGAKARKKLDKVLKNGLQASELTDYLGVADLADVTQIVKKNKSIDLAAAQKVAIQSSHADQYTSTWVDVDAQANKMASAISIAEDIVTQNATYVENKSKDTASRIASDYKKLSELNLTPEDRKTLHEHAGSLVSIKAALEEDGYKIPQYKVGTDFVPRDQLAILHQGEAVLNENTAKSYRSLKNALQHVVDIDTSNNAQALSEVQGKNSTEINLTEVVEAIRTQTSQLNQTLNMIISTLNTSSKHIPSISATSKVNERLTSFNPRTSNTRNLYAT